jgi:hypothetical protein
MENRRKDMSDYEMLVLKNGGRWDFWVSQVATIGRYVDAHAKELTKVQGALHSTAAAAPEAATRASSRTIMWDPTRGGMRMPHLHYAGEIFILNEGQWAEFSKSAVSALAEKMGKAQKVTFESVMQVSDAIAGM